MIYLITGEDTFKRQAALEYIIAQESVPPEKLDGVELVEHQLADAIAGATLFSAKRLIIIRSLSENKPLWDKFADWLPRVSDDTTLVLVESGPDKRTKTYKHIAKSATVIVADPWTERQSYEAEKWTVARAKELGFALSTGQARQLVERATRLGERPNTFMIDQQQLAGALATLRVLDDVTDDDIATVLPASHADSVFDLLDAALAKNGQRVQELLVNLRATADPYMVLGFIASQWAQLVALKVAGESPDATAARIGSSPYVLKKLAPHAKGLSRQRVGELTHLLAELDVKMKTTGVEPWVVVDRFIGEVVQ